MTASFEFVSDRAGTTASEGLLSAVAEGSETLFRTAARLALVRKSFARCSARLAAARATLFQSPARVAEVPKTFFRRSATLAAVQKTFPRSSASLAELSKSFARRSATPASARLTAIYAASRQAGLVWAGRHPFSPLPSRRVPGATHPLTAGNEGRRRRCVRNIQIQ